MKEPSDNHNIDQLSGLFRNQFEGFAPDPSPATWSSLQWRLWWIRFMRFSLTTFNIYYMVALLITGSLTIILLEKDNILPDSGFNPSVQKRPEIRPNSDVYHIDSTSDIQNQKDTRLNSLDSSEDKANQIASKPNDIRNSKVNKDLSEPNTHFSIASIIGSGKGILEVQTFPNASKQEELTIGNSISPKERGLENSTESDNWIMEDRHQPLQKIGSEELIRDNEQNKSLDTNRQEVDGFDEADDMPASEQSPLAISSVVYDTIRVFDTIAVYDTIQTKHHSSSVRERNRGQWYFDLTSGVNQTSFLYDHASQEIRDDLNGGTLYGTGWLFGSQVGYSGHRLFAETGLSYHRNVESFRYTAVNSVNENQFWIYQFNGYYHQTDTVSWQFIYNPEDTSYILIPVIVDSVFPNIDSTLVGFPKTDYRNQYSYVNIPFVTGIYLYRDQRIQVSAKAGINAGIFINAKGKTLSHIAPNTLTSLDQSSLPFLKVLLSWQAGIGITYRINDRFMILVDPVYRRTAGSVFSSAYPVNAVKEEFAIQIGLRYLIPVKD
jgi:hypothetical protein